ncbi:MAG: ribose-phosphate pyrophosphokinase [Spirochaetales bacterium]|nr:ribose-phosphate pyrophosphokinase [Spirochaetales bacterium]
MRGKLQIFATRSMQDYTDKVVEGISTYFAYNKPLYDLKGNLSVSRFADGEMEVEITSSVRGHDVFLFANASKNSSGISVEENKIEIYNAVDALRRAQAGRITLFEPYCSPGRSDRTTRRNSVGLWMHFKILISLGVDHIITFNLHSDKSRTMIDPAVCAIDDIPILFLLKRYIADTYIKTVENLEKKIRKEWVFCSVDAGGEVLAKEFADSFCTPLVISHKQRDYSCVNRVLSVDILSSTALKNKTVWIIDDMIDTGGSIYKLALELRKREVACVNIAVVHPVFSPPSIDRMKELIDKGILKDIVFADTLYCPQELVDTLKNVTVVSSHKVASDIISRLNQEMTLSEFFGPFNVYEYLNK